MKRGARLVILGKQGAGKGTQGERLCRALRRPSTSRRASSSATRPRSACRPGSKAKEYMDRGELVPDEIVVDVVEERFSNPAEVEDGFVLDGFPRTANQAEELDRILGERYPARPRHRPRRPDRHGDRAPARPGPRGRHPGVDPAAPGALRPGDQAAHRPLPTSAACWCRSTASVKRTRCSSACWTRSTRTSTRHRRRSLLTTGCRSAPGDHPQEPGPDRADAARPVGSSPRCTSAAPRPRSPGSTTAEIDEVAREVLERPGRPLELPELQRLPRGDLHVAERRDRARDPRRRRARGRRHPVARLRRDHRGLARRRGDHDPDRRDRRRVAAS